MVSGASEYRNLGSGLLCFVYEVGTAWFTKMLEDFPINHELYFPPIGEHRNLNQGQNKYAS